MSSKIPVLIELAIEPTEGHGSVPSLPPLPVTIDRAFGSVAVPSGSPGGFGIQHGGQGVDNTVIRGELDLARLDELRAAPKVRAVWSDPEISPFTAAAIDCDLTNARGSYADVARLLGAHLVWEAGVDGCGVVIGIVDGGVDKAKYPVDDGWTPNPGAPWGVAAAWNEHGNMCAFDSLVAAPKARLYDLAIGRSVGTVATLASALLAFQWALDRYRKDGTPQILSNSWGLYQQAHDPLPPGDPGNYTHNPEHVLVRKALELAEAGILIVFAAGNCGDGCALNAGRCGEDRGPGRSIRGLNGHPRIITVGAVNPERVPIGYSSQGPATFPNGTHKPDVCGYSHFSGDTPCDNGTSAACPVVAGVLALMRAKNPALNQDRALDILRRTARPIHSLAHHPATGFGVVDAVTAYKIT